MLNMQCVFPLQSILVCNNALCSKAGSGIHVDFEAKCIGDRHDTMVGSETFQTSLNVFSSIMYPKSPYFLISCCIGKKL